MGVSSSRIDEDKALQLCRERKKFIRQALDGRCSLAMAHVSYIQSLRNIGTSLRKFVEPDAPIDSSLYTFTRATPRSHALMEKSPSQSSLSTPSVSQRHDTFSPSPSPQPASATRFHVNHRKFRGFSSKKVEEKPPLSVTGTVTSSSTPQENMPRSAEKPESFPFEETSPMPSEEPPWDYFDLVHPIDDQISPLEGSRTNPTYDSSLNYARHHTGGMGLSEPIRTHKDSFQQKNIEESDDEFNESSSDTLVRSFKNLNRIHGDTMDDGSPDGASKRSIASESECSDQDRNSSPPLSPVRAVSSTAVIPNNSIKAVGETTYQNKVAPKDIFTTMKEIELLFIRASVSGKEVPRMLEATKLHFRPLFPGKESVSSASIFLKSCFSCGEDPSQVQEEEPAQESLKYLTWHRTESSPSSSSRNPLGFNPDDVEELNSSLFDNIYMIAGSHASTLDRLYAWERKLHDEVKASKVVREDYDFKCKVLRQMEFKGVSPKKIDKLRAVVKDLHSRIRVAIQRIDSISKRIEELRDKELQPQLEELIEGLSQMWKVMSDCHKIQVQMIAVADKSTNFKINLQSEAHRHLEEELDKLALNFENWMAAQQSYLRAIDNWLHKCVLIQQQRTKRKRWVSPAPLRNYGPPIYATCGVWIERLDKLPTKDVCESLRLLAAEVGRLLPGQEKKGKLPHGLDRGMGSVPHEEVSDDFVCGLDGFCSHLERFLREANSFSESSVRMYEELKESIHIAGRNYEALMSQKRAA